MVKIRDRQTGRLRNKDMKRSRQMAKAAKTRRYARTGGTIPVAVRKKIALGVKKAWRTGRTQSGRRALLKTR